MTIVEWAALASLLSALAVTFGIGSGSGPAPAWSKDPITVPGLMAGGFISAFWVLAYRELNSKRYYKDQSSDLTRELDRVLRGSMAKTRELDRRLQLLTTNGIDPDLPAEAEPEPAAARSTSRSPARRRGRVPLTRSASVVSATENGDSLGNQFS